LPTPLQSKCSLLQAPQVLDVDERFSARLDQCMVHRAAGKIKALQKAKVKVLKCTDCSGCQVCNQTVPLMVLEGTGGSGCSVEVAAVADMLHAAVQSKASSSKPGTSEAQQTGGGEAGGGMPSKPGVTGSDATAPANSALVECAVCHRKPGDPGVPATLKLCGGCKMARYCSAECQKKDWRLGHKAVCLGFKASLKNPAVG
jgi:hypothetical protein